MSSLTGVERIKLEKLLRMDGGYVLEFSNNSFQSFIGSSIGIDIYDNKYAILGESKANRLRAFWEIENDKIVAGLLNALIQVWEIDTDGPIVENSRALQTDCDKIVERLSGQKSPSTDESISTKQEFLEKQFESVVIDKLPMDSALIQIMKSRIKEIQISLSNGAALASIILSGSTLEGLLLGVASSNPKQFNECKISPKNSDDKVKEFSKWTLYDMINVAYELRILGKDVKEYSHNLRGFRNYIHPYEQWSSKFNPDIDTAKISYQVLLAAINDILKNKIS
ncbi:MAG: hypothetical protein ABJG47_14660 [Ekhidna sp.]